MTLSFSLFFFNAYSYCYHIHHNEESGVSVKRTVGYSIASDERLTPQFII